MGGGKEEEKKQTVKEYSSPISPMIIVRTLVSAGKWVLPSKYR